MSPIVKRDASFAILRVMSSPTPTECPRCQAATLPGATLPGATRCNVCGRSWATQDSESISTPSTAPPARIVDNPYAVLAAVFLAAMILGVPLIWMCRAWSTSTKIMLTVVTILYTIVVFWLFWMVMVWVWSRISDAL